MSNQVPNFTLNKQLLVFYEKKLPEMGVFSQKRKN